MAENLNLSLDFADAASGGEEAARVRVDSACSYSRETGAPLITNDCRSADAFAEEIARLRTELDAILSEARARFEGRTPEPPEPPAAEPVAETKRPLSVRDDLRVRDRMTRDVKTLGRNDKIRLADELMKVGRFRHVVVVDDGGKVAGVVSQRDICFTALDWAQGQGRTAHERALESVAVKEVMRASISTIEADAPLVEAARRMASEKIGCLPVMDGDRLVGILTEGDFLALLTDASRDG